MQSSTDTERQPVVDITEALPGGGTYVRKRYADGSGYEGVVGIGQPIYGRFGLSVDLCGASRIGRIAEESHPADEADWRWDEQWQVQP